MTESTSMNPAGMVAGQGRQENANNGIICDFIETEVEAVGGSAA